MTGNTQQRAWTRRGWLRCFGALALAGAVLAGTAAPSDALANPNRPVRYAPPEGPSATANQGKAVVSVVVVKADKSGKVDPNLKSLERQLSSFGLTGFKTVSQESMKLGKGQSDTIPGGAGRKLKATMVSHDGEKARVRLQLLKGSESKLDTTVRLHKGKAFIVKGPKVPDGAMVYLVTYK